MALSKIVKNTMLLAFTILFLSSALVNANSSKVISEEVLSRDRLFNRVKVFNEWYAKLNPTAKVEAKLSQEGKVILAAKADLKAEDAYLTVNRNSFITPKLIYETKIGDFVKSLEATYGYDDALNIVFFLLHEMGNPESKWKPYLDVLPRKPESLAFKYWDRKAPIEEELLNTPVLSNLYELLFFNFYFYFQLFPFSIFIHFPFCFSLIFIKFIYFYGLNIETFGLCLLELYLFISKYMHIYTLDCYILFSLSIY